ncbi:MAG: tetratricopeptide repeat protein [Planctomycetes bacterium]|nr:tetratricopeptide repeat protein [Planctomycetota bacterium]
MPMDVRTMADLRRLTLEQLAAMDIAAVNLACAENPCGSEVLDVDSSLRKLDLWAAVVARETQRLLPRFAENPDYYDRSEPTFRVVTLVLTLKNLLGVHYNLDQAVAPTFEDSRDQFLHGLTDSSRGGTCVSMPVLMVAIGRRLGYPLKLALAHEHVYFRWDDGISPPLNFECTNPQGMDSHPDEHYMVWPRSMSAIDLDHREFLVSLTPKEELSLFLAARGHCLLANGRIDEAREAYRTAVRLFPTARQFRICLSELEARFAPPRPRFSVPDPSEQLVQPRLVEPRLPIPPIPRVAEQRRQQNALPLPKRAGGVTPNERIGGPP